MISALLRLSFICIALILPQLAGGDFDHQHEGFAVVLSQHVKEGRVDYSAIQQQPEPLLAYLLDLAQVSRETFHDWTREQQLAYLLNLYNAQTIDLVRRRYPIQSIRDIGSILRNAWGQPVVTLFGRIISLDTLLNQAIRPFYQEPLVHVALVPAARGAAPLRGEPYLAHRLQEQLDDQMRTFLATPTRNRIDHEEKTLILSPIFEWHKADFVGAGGSLIEVIRPYLPDEDRERMGDQVYRVRFATFDWSLND